MTKTKRFIALILVLVCCFTLSGCVDIDELRKSHGIWADETHNTILLNDKVYERLMFNDRLSIDVEIGSTGYVTDANVPVLIKDMYGEWFWMDEDGLYIWMDIDDDYDKEYFCLSEKHEEITAMLEDTSIMKNYYYDYRDGSDNKYKRYFLTDEEVDAIADCLLDGENERIIPYDEGLTYDYYVQIYRCDDSEVFSEFCWGIMAYENRYYICMYTIEETMIYEVTEDDFPIFGKMLQEYTEKELDWEAA